MGVISGMEAALGGGGTFDIQPPAGEAYKITRVESDVAKIGVVSDLSLAIRDATLADAQITDDPSTDPGNRTRPYEIYITNENYLRVTNDAAGNANIAWSGEQVNANNVITDLVEVGAAGDTDIQPPEGETWMVTEFAYSVRTVAGDLNPDVIVRITDGTLVASMIIQETNIRGHDKQQRWLIDNDTYLRVSDGTVGGGGIFGYCGIRVPMVSIGSIQDVVGSATLDIQPPATEEWEIFEIAAETWAGGGVPNNNPNITVHLMVGANLAEVMEAGSVIVSPGWGEELKLLLSNDTFLRITEVSTGNNEVGILGRLLREFSV